MKKTARTFLDVLINAAAVIVLAALILNWAVPFAEVWFSKSCRGITSSTCAATDLFLSYWWLALLILIIPSVTLLTIYRHREPNNQAKQHQT
jgi:type II secretory pathway component PulF